MKNYTRIVVLFNLVLLLVYMNYSVIQKERILEKGKLIFLELAPADPRSLMQGDYMLLRYSLSDSMPATIPKRGYCVVVLDHLQRASLVRFQENATPKAAAEWVINYTAPNPFDIKIGASSYFFQEGQSKKYEKAKYGGIKIDTQGHSLLIGLYDAELRKIE